MSDVGPQLSRRGARLCVKNGLKKERINKIGFDDQPTVFAILKSKNVNICKYAQNTDRRPVPIFFN